MMGVVGRDRELELVTKLCRELAKLGLNVGLSDARPAVVVRTGAEPPLWITVDASGESFEWCDAGRRHPVTDLSGAAALISDHINARRSGPGEAS